MISYVLGGRLRTSKWPSRSVRMLRNIPAACDFNFTATWLAGRLFAFKSTVPEIFPSVCSETGACACAIGAQTVAAILKKRRERNPALRHDFFTFRNLHSISTCCALLRHSLRRLGGWGRDRKSTRLNSSHGYISYAVFCLKKKKPT